MATAIQIPQGCKVCPTCNRKFTQPKVSDKKLAEDIAKCERSIDICDDYARTNRFNLGQACAAEAVRLRRALNDSKLLWSIYRRQDRKGTGYGISIVQGGAR